MSKYKTILYIICHSDGWGGEAEFTQQEGGLHGIDGQIETSEVLPM